MIKRRDARSYYCDDITSASSSCREHGNRLPGGRRRRPHRMRYPIVFGLREGARRLRQGGSRLNRPRAGQGTRPRRHDESEWPLPNRNVERVAGIEPAHSAWEADELPLHHTRPRVACSAPSYRPRRRLKSTPRHGRLTRPRARSYGGAWHRVPLVICPAGLRRGETSALKRPVRTLAPLLHPRPGFSMRGPLP